ncbi:MAG: hypothetical protein WAL24_10555, partial [Nitrososphaeraceae archaeon]
MLHGDRELPELCANSTDVAGVGLTMSGTSFAAPAHNYDTDISLSILMFFPYRLIQLHVKVMELVCYS